MWLYISLTCGFALLLGAVIALAKSNGSKAAQVEALKAEVTREYEERKRANKIIDSVRNMPAADVRSRLQNLSGK